MTIQQPAAPTSIAEALDAGIAAANAGGAPPPPPADDDESGTGGSDDSTNDSGDQGDGTQDSTGGDAGESEGAESGDGTGQDGDGADPADPDVSGDGSEGGDPAEGDADASGAGGKPGSKDGKPGDAEAKKPNHYDDPIPNALKPATKERIRFLANDAKEQRALAETATAERNELIAAVQDTGANPQQYAGMLDYLALVNSGDQNKLKQAANFMIRELASLSRVGGFRIPGVTSYAGYPDLEKAVGEGKMTQEVAEELAASRSATAHAGKVSAAGQQASRQRAAYEAADRSAREEMNAIEAGYVKSDPLYKAKKAVIVGMLNEQIRGDREKGIPPLHPSKWAAMYQKIYNGLPKTGVWGGSRPGAGAAPAARVPQNQPLRGQQPAGGQKPEPKSVAEAIEMGIDLAR